MGIQKGKENPQEQNRVDTSIEKLIQKYSKDQPQGHIDLTPTQLEELIKKIIENQIAGNRKVLVVFSDIKGCEFCLNPVLQAIVENTAKEAAEKEVPLIANVASVNQGFYALRVNITRYKAESVTEEVIRDTPSMQHMQIYPFPSVPTCALFGEQDGQIKIIAPFAVQNGPNAYDRQYENDLRNLLDLTTSRR